jgi:hypothetical protein
VTAGSLGIGRFANQKDGVLKRHCLPLRGLLGIPVQESEADIGATARGIDDLNGMDWNIYARR